MNRPRLLDLFCCAGGAAMGYHRAGFDVTGVDIKPQKRYPFAFVQADALEYLREHGHEYDAIHASPPCQAYTALKSLSSRKHPDLLAPTREALRSTGKPYVIENVPRAPMSACLILCGTMFGLRTPCGSELRRHRLFETNWFSGMVPPCAHGSTPVICVAGHTPNDHQSIARRRAIGVYGDKPYDPAIYRAEERLGRTISVVGATPRDMAIDKRDQRARVVTVAGNTPQQNTVHNQERETFSVADAGIAMGIDWMVMKELSQAIPPAYTEFIGAQLIRALDGVHA